MKLDTIRSATAHDRLPILRLWHEGWHDAHADLVPKPVLAYRKPEHFALWLDSCDETVFVACAAGEVVGFYAVDGAELVKLFVRRDARGSGLAQALLAGAEDRLQSRGIEIAELFCTAGNGRAERFYEKHDWQRQRTFPDRLWHPSGAGGSDWEVTTHRYIKRLVRDGGDQS